MVSHNNPNKYSKNANIKPDSLIKQLIALVSLLLMLLGIVGLAVELFSHSTWLNGAWFISMYEKATASIYNLIYVPLIWLAWYLFKRVFLISQGAKAVKPTKKGDFPMYLLIAVGVYYAFRLISMGTL